MIGMDKLREGEEVVPDRPELRGTVAERLAAMRVDPAFALWAVRFGPPGFGVTVADAADRMWGDCRRPDWMADALMLSAAGKAGGELHRRLVAHLCRATRARVGDRAGQAAGRALNLALGWAERSPTSVLEVPVRSVVDAAEALNADVGATMRALAQGKQRGWSPEDEAAAYVRFGAAAGAFFAASSVFDPRAVATAAMVLALLSTGGAGVVSDEVAAALRAEFSVPEELRS